MVYFRIEHDFELVQRVLDCMERFFVVSGLKINPDKTEWMNKNAWISMELLMYDLVQGGPLGPFFF